MRTMRRGVLGLGLASVLATRADAALADLAFVVVREGREIGTHAVRFRWDAGLLRAVTEVRIIVRLAGFVVYRYAHDAEETWHGQRLVALDSRLDRNGRTATCTARVDGDGLRLRGPAGEALLPAGAAPLTWWRAASLVPGVPLFDPREGRPVEPRLDRRPEAGGQRVTLTGGEGAVVLYDAAATWVGFETTGEDGSRVIYRKA